MPTSIELHGVTEIRELPLSTPLDEAVWQAWVEKGRAQERRNGAARIEAVKWVSVAGLLVVAGLGSHLASYDSVIRFLVAASAIVLMFHAIHAGHYAFAAVFASLAVLYNPVAPVFSLSGQWQRGAVVATALPFAASLAWRNLRMAHHE